MQHLTDEDWRSFHEDKRKGIRFEDLVEVLLPQLYPGQWIRTAASWDRGKDFWRRDGSSTLAAECKMYRDNVSIQVLSKTLVMAIVDELSRVLFFSYSALNENALAHLTQYQAQTGKSVEIYDDEKLEQLILKTPDAYKFFPRLKTPLKVPGTVRLLLTEHVSRDPDVEYLDMKSLHGSSPLKGYGFAQLYETITLDIFLTNESLEPVSGTITIDRKTVEPYMMLLDRSIVKNDYQIPFDIPRAGVAAKRLHLKLMRSSPAQPLPEYTVEAGVEVRDLRHRRALEVPALLRPPLIGRRYFEAQRDVHHLFTSRERPVFAALFGPSGTGKSRLLDEIRDDLLGEGFTVYRFRGETNKTVTFDELLRKFVAKRFRLPLSLPAEDSDQEAPQSATVPPLILRVLYDRSYVPAEHVDNCRDLMFGALEGTRAAIVIDDVQGFDENTVELLNEMVTRGRSGEGRLAVLFTLNTDLAGRNSPHSALLQRVRDEARASGGKEATQFLAIPVEGFTPEDALSYLDHCFSESSASPAERFTATHPETVKLFIENVPLQPLYIEQFLLFAVTEGLIERTGSSLYVRHPTVFDQYLRSSVPPNIESIIAGRWSHVERDLGHDARRLVDLLTLLVYLPASLAPRWKITPSAVRQLHDAGFVRVEDTDALTFHHQLFFRFFKQRSIVRDAAWASEMLEQCDILQTEYPAQYLLLVEQTRPVRADDLRIAIDAIDRDRAAVEYLPEFASAVLRSATACDVGDRGKLLGAFRASGQRMKSRIGFATAFDFLRQVAARELPKHDVYNAYGDAYLRLALACANIHVTVREDYGAAVILDRALEIFDEFRFKDTIRSAEIECALLNRLCVARRSLSLRVEAIAAGQRSLARARQAGLQHMVMQNHVDLGYVYYGRLADRAALVREWSAALETITPENIPSSMVTGPNVWFYHRTHVLALREQFDDAADAILDAVADAARNLDTFHLVKLLAMDVVVGLIRNRQSETGRLTAVCRRAIDLCVRHDARQTYWVACHLLAKVAERRRDSQTMRDATRAAFEQLMLFLGGHPEMQERYHEPLLDLAYMARKSDCELPLHDVARIASGTVRMQVEGILRANHDGFRSLCDAHEPLGTYHDGHFDLPCP